MIFFQQTRGRVVRVLDQAVQCRTRLIGLTDPTISYDDEYSIMTRAVVSEQENVQFTHMLGSHVYVYAFGNKVGSMALSGLAFTCACDADEAGMVKMYRWYKRHRVSKRRTPLQVTIGNEPVEGFLTNITLDVVDAQTEMVQWNLSLTTLPED